MKQNVTPKSKARFILPQKWCWQHWKQMNRNHINLPSFAH